MSNYKNSVFNLFCLAAIVLLASSSNAFSDVIWTQKSSIFGDLPVPNSGSQQTCCISLDVDNDGTDDFIIGERTQTPSLVWYKFNGQGWDRFIIDDTPLKIEAGGASADIDGDHDLDIVFGQDASGEFIWWWENPYPDFSNPWKRRIIKQDGANKHHDQSIADYDGDGKLEFISWNQRGGQLLWFEIPENPKTEDAWKYQVIYSWNGGKELEGVPSHPVDVDLDGKLDIVGGGRWFKHKSGTEFSAQLIDDEMRFTQCAAGQLVEGGRPEIVFSPGDMDGYIKWYQWNGETWIGKPLRYIHHGHTCEIADLNQDGHLDILVGEMGQPGAADNAKLYVWYGDGKGHFKETVIGRGQGIHEGTLGDFDGDNDLDVLVKPYHHKAPRVDLLINQGPKHLPLNKWKRHLISELPTRSMFVVAGDMDEDGRIDLAAGAWWWKNPGANGSQWVQNEFGDPLRNLALLHDFDLDGDLDVIGTQGVGSEKNNQFVWAQNNGSGQFKILNTIQSGGDGDFLQGRFIESFGANKQIWLSWHNDGGGIQALTLPEKPTETEWPFSTITSFTEKEDLDAADIDGDGDLDVLIGLHWLQNNNGEWTQRKIGTIPEGEADRFDLVDVNGDSRLDVVMGLELSQDVFWFEAPEDRTQEWTRHFIGTIDGQGFSMDAGDIDNDGDPDIVIGEHRGPEVNRVVIIENTQNGAKWNQHVIDSSSKDEIDHHDGTQLIDIDLDGDLDLISIGWYNPKLWLYENLAIDHAKR